MMMVDPNLDRSSDSLDELIYKRENGLLICQWNINNITSRVETILNYIVCTKNPDIFIPLRSTNEVYSQGFVREVTHSSIYPLEEDERRSTHTRVY